MGNEKKYTQILSASENMKAEYCCNIIKVGELRPIEGSDFLAQTFINGDSVVVRKDQVKEGDIFFFAMNECALNDTFLKANSLFREKYAEENANYTEKVLPIKEGYDKLNGLITQGLSTIRKLERARRLLDHVSDEEAPEKFKKMISEIYPDNRDIQDFYKIDDVQQKKDKLTSSIEELKNNVKADLVKLKELSTAISRNCGFFERNGRVRAIKLKGTPSFGYMFSQDELAKAYPEVADLDMELHIGEDFDTVCGELFAVPYVPKQPQTSGHGRSKSKAPKKYENLIEGEFMFHYDTDPLGKNIWKIKPTDNVVISNKLHGSSAIFANVPVKHPIKLNWFNTAKNWIISHTGNIFAKFATPTYYVDYGEIWSSRKVIKNPELNPMLSSGYYASDIWSDWHDKLTGKIEKDMTVYGEIIGYETGDTERMIQKQYDYGCQPGENFFMPYRITKHNRETNELEEWDIEDVYQWTLKLIKDYPELKATVKPIDIFYHGPFCELYPDLPVDEHWHDNVIIRMTEDKELFGMELNEPLCRNKVPREGLVIRVDKDKVPRAYKLKTVAFRDYERKQIDNGEIDSEMDEGYN